MWVEVDKQKEVRVARVEVPVPVPEPPEPVVPVVQKIIPAVITLGCIVGGILHWKYRG